MTWVGQGCLSDRWMHRHHLHVPVDMLNFDEDISFDCLLDSTLITAFRSGKLFFRTLGCPSSAAGLAMSLHD